MIHLRQAISEALDTLILARTVHRLAREVDSLTALARSQEDRADIAEAAAEEYRRLYEDEKASHGRTLDAYQAIEVDRGLLAIQRDETARALEIARKAAGEAEWTAQGEVRKRKEAERERDDARRGTREAHDMLDALGSPLSRLAAPLAMRIAALFQQGIGQSLSTAKVKEASNG